MPACDHARAATLPRPTASTPVYKEECTQCFADQDSADGVDVCLTCFNGGCPAPPHVHAQQHALKTGHQLALNIRRVPKADAAAAEPPAKLTRLEIREEDDSEKYAFETFVRCWGCGGARVDAAGDVPGLDAAIQGVLHAVEAAKGHEIKAWAEEVTACPHFEGLAQQPAAGFALDQLQRCAGAGCDKRDNLWLCLTCGHAGCGRRQYDGSGGNNHGVEHYERTGHPVSIKLGTITPEGTGDAYCYACDDNRMDPHLAAHLRAFGIRVEAQQKTEKSVAELQLEQNLKFDFSMTTADGAQLAPAAGPGLTGLRNLGNSCYLAAVAQCLFAVDRFRDRYFPSAAAHFAACTHPRPAQCVLCQLHKLADGLWSGRYAALTQSPDGTAAGHQHGISPAHFKAAIAAEHPEFASMRQQDAFEFLLHLSKQIDVAERATGSAAPSPTSVFAFTVEERLQCTRCRKVRYKTQPAASVSLPIPKRPAAAGDGALEPVSLAECLDLMTAEDTVDGYRCPSCEQPTAATKTTRFATFPKVLAVQARRFELVDWVPQKLEIPLQVPLGPIELAPYRAAGIQPGEEPLPEDPADGDAVVLDAAASQPPPVDEAVVAQLESMGFPHARCVKAVRRTGNAGAEAATNWLFEHMDDPDIDVPDEAQAQAQAQGAADPAAVEQLVAMGFPADSAARALAKAGGNPERALDRLLSGADDGDDGGGGGAGDGDGPGGDASDASADATRYELTGFISHKGSSVHCGHYVASVRHGLGPDAQWFLINDAKVAAQPEPQSEQAYVYFFTRTDDQQ
ncbi:ubiquitin C-terminal hydrolase Ubp14 [Coemansia javaensis]|uniref:Ubiquitin carboxyl-terminal hydrolase n=1 Tax=Coemansia javaensis TaxID=2761396 RepID=A0A9W8LM86_9FUNG|nr:ubiquitin C-terminal hydrolase Ubp14 [Coemansia javaensis]